MTTLTILSLLAGIGVGVLVLRSRWYRALNARLRFRSRTYTADEVQSLVRAILTTERGRPERLVNDAELVDAWMEWLNERRHGIDTDRGEVQTGAVRLE
jgi:hypothetical protein